MTPKQISKLVDALTPDIRIALRDIFENQTPIHAFDIDGTTNGVKTHNSHSVIVMVFSREMADSFMNGFGRALVDPAYAAECKRRLVGMGLIQSANGTSQQPTEEAEKSANI